MKEYDLLLERNKAWSEAKVASDPEYFTALAEAQTPDFLWIGCSDSRVPANEITGTSPGEIFVHRNIANMVIHTDMNLLSVLEYAVNVLKVKNIIVCGHYGCGGIKAASTRLSYGIINAWLRNIKDVYRIHQEELNELDPDSRHDRLVELNVIEQVHNLAKTSIVQSAWKNHELPHLHGWVYGLSTGLIKPIVDILPNTPIDPIYDYTND